MTEIIKKRVKVEREVTRRVHRYKWVDIVQLIKEDVQRNCPEKLYLPKHKEIEVIYQPTSKPSDHPSHVVVIRAEYDTNEPEAVEAKEADTRPVYPDDEV